MVTNNFQQYAIVGKDMGSIKGSYSNRVNGLIAREKDACFGNIMVCDGEYSIIVKALSAHLWFIVESYNS